MITAVFYDEHPNTKQRESHFCMLLPQKTSIQKARNGLFRDWSLITGRGGAREVLPLRKGGGGGGAEGGHNKF